MTVLKRAVLPVLLTSELIRKYNELTHDWLVWRSLTIHCSDGCVRRIVACMKIRDIEYVTFLTFLPRTGIVDSLPCLLEKDSQLQAYGKIQVVLAEKWQELVTGGTFFDLGFDENDKRFEILSSLSTM